MHDDGIVSRPPWQRQQIWATSEPKKLPRRRRRRRAQMVGDSGANCVFCMFCGGRFER